MGVAGAGKSVQGTLLAEKLNYQWLSTGEYLRANITPERKEGMMQGKLLADEEIIDILKDFFDDIDDQNRSILDGFPRTLTQAKWLYEQHKSGKINIADVIYLNASKEVVLKRLLGRGRSDDNREALEKRFQEYEELTLPIIDWLKQQGIRVYEINAERSIEDIQKEIVYKIAT